MNPDKSTDDDLRARFAILREEEAREVPGFRSLLAAAREAGPGRRAALPWCIAGATAAAAAVAILTIPMLLKSSAPPASLAVLPVLLSPPSGSSPFLDAPLIAGSELPTDDLLPLHLQIRF
ncbi:MAG: hypothetical protein KGR69_13885 [Verrucomicrobia bacterium]|jgi:hypothetical protein|nr:hypothetical protein [Verrucomicrobiota bacterium]